MVTILWEYQVKADRAAEFEQIYSSDGKWAELFKKSEGFITTHLFKSPNIPNHFLTIDQWETMKDYKTFLSQWKEEYEALEKRCEDLTEYESCLGMFGDGFDDKNNGEHHYDGSHPDPTA